MRFNKGHGTRYTGTVHLHETYQSPKGVSCVPVAFRLEGILVQFADGTRIVRRGDFAEYTRVQLSAEAK